MENWKPLVCGFGDKKDAFLVFMSLYQFPYKIVSLSLIHLDLWKSGVQK